MGIASSQQRRGYTNRSRLSIRGGSAHGADTGREAAVHASATRAAIRAARADRYWTRAVGCRTADRMCAAKLLPFALALPLLAACAKGETGGFGGALGAGGTGGESQGTTTSGGTGGASSTSSSGSTTAGSSGNGGVPTTCDGAHGNTGCCDGDTLYYCKTGSTTLTQTACSGSKVCGWNEADSYYTCVAAPGGADPSNANPEACN